MSALGGRLFLGVPLPAPVREQLQAELLPSLARLSLRATPPANLHATLRFLGDTGDAAAARIDDALARHPLPLPFTVELAGLGAFPRPGRASVLWLGFGEGREALVALADAVSAALAEVGTPPDPRPFHPHVTLARARSPLDLSVGIERLPPVTAPFTVEEVVLFRSHLGSGAPRYEAVRRYGPG